MAIRIADAMFVIDQRVLHILAPIIRISVFEPARIEPAERILAKEQRSAKVGTDRQLDVVIVDHHDLGLAPQPEQGAGEGVAAAPQADEVDVVVRVGRRRLVRGLRPGADPA